MAMEVMDGKYDQNADGAKDTMCLLAGAALVLLGSGLILSNHAVRRHLRTVGIGNLVQAAMPTIEKYMKLRAL
jgi:hypothetical protein